MFLNARTLAKPHTAPAFYVELSNNKMDACFVSESWLNRKILSHLICPEGYVMVRKDRDGSLAGGGVCDELLLFVGMIGGLKRLTSLKAWNPSLHGTK